MPDLNEIMANAKAAYNRDPRSESQLSFDTDTDPGDETDEKEDDNAVRSA